MHRRFSAASRTPTNGSARDDLGCAVLPAILRVRNAPATSERPGARPTPGRGDDIGSVEIVKAEQEVLEPGQRTLGDLGSEIRAADARVGQLAAKCLGEILFVGERLLEARSRCRHERVVWKVWLNDVCGLSQPSATAYMRAAHFRDVLTESSDDVTSVAATRRILVGLPGPTSLGGRMPPPQDLVDTARRLRDEGFSQSAIGEALGVTRSAIRDWTDPAAAEKRRVQDREHKRRQAKAKAETERAEREQAVKRAVRKKGGARAEAYAMGERFQDVIAQAHREEQDRESREAWSRAGEHYRKMRDEIVRALGVS